MTTYTLTLTDHVTRAQMTVQVAAHSYSEAIDVAWQRWCRRSHNRVTVK